MDVFSPVSRGKTAASIVVLPYPVLQAVIFLTHKRELSLISGGIAVIMGDTSHSVENYPLVCIKNGEFAGKMMLCVVERYKVFGSVAMYHQVLHCITLQNYINFS